MHDISVRKPIVRPMFSWLLVAAMALPALPTFAAGESLSARVRSCASETDSLRRLVCYDKNVAPYADPASDARRDGAPAAQAAVGEAQVIAKPNIAAEPVRQNQPSGIDEPKQAKAADAQKPARHISARVVSIEKDHGDMVLRLDNGQVWVQLQEASADMNLQVGDTVSIDKNLVGSYWLGGRSEGVMKVRRKE